jgi:hypothetical protein
MKKSEKWSTRQIKVNNDPNRPNLIFLFKAMITISEIEWHISRYKPGVKCTL